eukprot:4087963-Alexandrium_andersonii.AAC.1
MSASLVGSEMCIRDRCPPPRILRPATALFGALSGASGLRARSVGGYIQRVNLRSRVGSRATRLF